MVTFELITKHEAVQIFNMGGNQKLGILLPWPYGLEPETVKLNSYILNLQ